MPEDVWYVLASPGVALAVGFIVAILFCRTGNHVDGSSKVSQTKLLSVFLQSIACYTILLLSVVQIAFKGDPPISKMISEGFGDNRIAYVMIGVAAELGIKIWNEFRKTPD